MKCSRKCLNWMIALVAVTVSGQTSEVHELLPRRLPVQANQKLQATPAPRALALSLSLEPCVTQLVPVSAERVAEAEMEAAARCDCNGSPPPRSGFVRPVARPESKAKTAWHSLKQPDGSKLWILAVRSPGAVGLRLHFRRCEMGDRSLLVWAPASTGIIVRGPYSARGPNGTGDFWTAYLPGDTAYIEAAGDTEPGLELAEIVHFDRNVGGMRSKGEATAPAAWCHLDAMCYGASQVNLAARDAVVQLNFVSGGNSYLCSGTILNTLDSETAMPYLLTAYHCLHTQAEVNSLEAVWFWQRGSCGGTLPGYALLPRLVGGTLLESNPTSGGNDMTFIRLAGSLPAGATLAGWTTSYSDSSYGIHHPVGSWKRVTFFHNSASPFSGCLFFDSTDYHFVRADDGFIEGGSSGSPLLNSRGQVMGQLYGICCNLGHGTECQGITCSGDRDDWRSVYGEFETTYPIIQIWLQIGGTIHVDRAITSGLWLGTPTHPMPFVGLANNFAWDGSRIKIKAGTYPEILTITKQVTLMADGGSVSIGL